MGTSNASQSDRILEHLKSGKTITPLEALNLYGCFRLGARIFELKKDGYNIRQKMLKMGNGKMVAEYRLVAKPIQTDFFVSNPMVFR